MNLLVLPNKQNDTDRDSVARHQREDGIRQMSHRYGNLFKRQWHACAWASTMLIAMLASSARADVVADFKAHKANALAQYQAGFDSLVAEHPDDPAMALFKERLALIDEVAIPILERFQYARKRSLDTLLDDLVPQPENAAGAPGPAAAMSGAEIIAEYEEAFRAGLRAPAVNEKDMAVLKAYYDVSAKAAGRFVAEQGRFIEAVDRAGATDILQLCLVVPLLHIDDAQWSQQTIADMPSWMTMPTNLAILEDFALQLCRPQTAYQFKTAQCAQAKRQEPTYGIYLLDAGEKKIGSREFYAGIHCLKTGLAVAESGGDAQTTISLRFRLAEIYRDSGHALLAAEQIKTLMDTHPDSDQWGRAAMLRLKYLYEASQFEKVVVEFKPILSNPAAKGYLPQVMYIGWVACRRINDMTAADKVQADFLKQFPKHPLAADMYFASAMTSLAASDYEEASRLLEIVEYRFPNSRLQAKVKQIRERLNTVQK